MKIFPGDRRDSPAQQPPGLLLDVPAPSRIDDLGDGTVGRLPVEDGSCPRRIGDQHRRVAISPWPALIGYVETRDCPDSLDDLHDRATGPRAKIERL